MLTWVGIVAGAVKLFNWLASLLTFRAGEQAQEARDRAEVDRKGTDAELERDAVESLPDADLDRELEE